jgi:hypothetical protein
MSLDDADATNFYVAHSDKRITSSSDFHCITMPMRPEPALTTSSTAAIVQARVTAPRSLGQAANHDARGWLRKVVELATFNRFGRLARVPRLALMPFRRRMIDPLKYAVLNKGGTSVPRRAVPFNRQRDSAVISCGRGSPDHSWLRRKPRLRPASARRRMRKRTRCAPIR